MHLPFASAAIATRATRTAIATHTTHAPHAPHTTHAPHATHAAHATRAAIIALVRRYSHLLSLALAFLLVLAQAVQPAHAGDPFEGAFFKRSYTGSIGGKYNITMELRKAGAVLRGSYRYSGKIESLQLEGKIVPDGSFILEERSRGKTTGTFRGEVAGKKVSGTWTAPGVNPKSPKALDFEVYQDTDVDMHDKAAVLRSAVGTYPLNTIQGSEGANGMYDTWREGRGWRSNSSSISMARREASDADLTRADIARLNSMQLSVDDKLTTRFSANGKVLVEIPYAPTPVYKLAEGHNSVVTDHFKLYDAQATVAEDTLFMLLRDGVDYDEQLGGNFELQAHDVMLILYKPAEQAFEVQFKNGDCCDTAILNFVRK